MSPNPSSVDDVFKPKTSVQRSLPHIPFEAAYPFSWRDVPPNALIAHLYCLGPIAVKLAKAVSTIKNMYNWGLRG